MLTDAQNGFRDNKSIHMATQTFIEDIQRVMYNRLLVMEILFNLTEAYYVINHNTLLAKLDHYGLRGTINSWISSYLSHRRQLVEIRQVDNKTSNLKSYTSSYKVIKHSIPQGSVLGPLLLLLYVYDLPLNIQGAKVVFLQMTPIHSSQNKTTNLYKKI